MVSSIIVEIRAGAGGDEASIFARDLFEMYSKYAQLQNWRCFVLDANYSDLNGLKQITFELKGENVLQKMKYEAGVHRVQRVPQTEKNNRLHTSTVSVAVLVRPPETEIIKINPSEIKMDFYKSSGPGGQNVNKRQTAVRITHLPSGLVVCSQVERGLEDNKRAALTILQTKLFEMKKNAAQNQILQERKIQIGKMERAEKIRTYNFPQDRLTDHRVGKSWHNLEKIMRGKLDDVVSKLQETLKD
ncbi:peptide chain release factor 1 [bacterium (Candidatus Gribaldobacteria) CG08_land_8_20_14_0_20_39_15]|uniref:Peptide chain release factor 1 n=1 Tax=bacterium (Candidatus Gribaldobacteria) CG08_land_8_20_14_0_20_39_15 TaxID=2014273 RepID=A0A2M6XU61_9BACT|nr:MAG: peptide chain release factor 1 [bacterium (Candidatus Gribaldobacteria) CG08_land_8_20_14_0_20_39_15]